jgi:hypothetical protein
MSGTSSTSLRPKPHSCMQVACPYCRTKMTVDVGLTNDTRKDSIQCLGCDKAFVPVVPGPVVGGPFLLDD